MSAADENRAPSNEARRGDRGTFSPGDPEEEERGRARRRRGRASAASGSSSGLEGEEVPGLVDEAAHRERGAARAAASGQSAAIEPGRDEGIGDEAEAGRRGELPAECPFRRGTRTQAHGHEGEAEGQDDRGAAEAIGELFQQVPVAQCRARRGRRSRRRRHGPGGRRSSRATSSGGRRRARRSRRLAGSATIVRSRGATRPPARPGPRPVRDRTGARRSSSNRKTRFEAPSTTCRRPRSGDAEGR